MTIHVPWWLLATTVSVVGGVVLGALLYFAVLGWAFAKGWYRK